jgi:hypothetical protein
MSLITGWPEGTGDTPPGGSGGDRRGAGHRGPTRTRGADSTARTARRALTCFGVCAAALGLFACYLRLAATFPVGSDGASNALEAWDLLHGNWLLHSWTLTDVSFYTTELPEYAAVELARGLNVDVVDTAATITYTLLVLAAAALARGRARGAETWARALIAAGIMVSPQLGNGIHVLLSQPDHVGTQVPLLGIFLLLDRAPRRWYTVAAIWALLVVTIVADKIAITDAVVPLVVVCLSSAARARMPGTARAASRAECEPGGPARRRARPVADRLRAHSFELSVAIAAVVAVGVAQLILIVITRWGGFTLLPVETRIVTPAGVPRHLSMTLQDILNLFGAEVRAAPPGPQAIIAWLHAPGVALAAAAFGIALWRLPGGRDLVSDVLVVGLVVTLAAFAASAIPSTPFDTREMVAVLPYGAVLAGRIFGPWLTAGDASRIRRPRFRPPRLRSGAAAMLALAGVCQLAALGYGATRPAPANPEQALAGWLANHHLTTGLGTYTEDNITTLDSRGAVRLRTVSWPRSGRAVPRLYQSSASWYDPLTAYANFVVSGTGEEGADLIPHAEILALAGPPARTYRFESFTITVWHENLLALLAGPPSHLPGTSITPLAPTGGRASDPCAHTAYCSVSRSLSAEAPADGTPIDPGRLRVGVSGTSYHSCYSLRMMLGVAWDADAQEELRRLPSAERRAVMTAVAKLEAFGDQLGAPHSSQVKGSHAGIRELRPRAGRSPWRVLYRRLGVTMVILAVGPEAEHDRRGFDRAVRLAEERLKEIEG